MHERPNALVDGFVKPQRMSGVVFDRFRELIYAKSGILLKDSKQTMLAARINKRIRALGLGDYRQYLERVELDPTGDELVELLDAVSTNVTSFFREPSHFELLGDLLEHAARSGARRIRLWSAACSTGQEPYSMAMTLLEAFRAVGREPADTRILATDLSTRVLERCGSGRYASRELESVPEPLRSEHFRRSDAGGYEADERVRRLLVVRRLNLAEPPYPMKGPMDAIFCRNVMIYFDEPVRRRIIGEARRLLRPGGLFMVGHSESLQGSLCDGFDRLGASAYRRR